MISNRSIRTPRVVTDPSAQAAEAELQRAKDSEMHQLGYRVAQDLKSYGVLTLRDDLFKQAAKIINSRALEKRNWSGEARHVPTSGNLVDLAHALGAARGRGELRKIEEKCNRFNKKAAEIVSLGREIGESPLLPEVFEEVSRRKICLRYSAGSDFAALQCDPAISAAEGFPETIKGLLSAAYMILRPETQKKIDSLVPLLTDFADLAGVVDGIYSEHEPLVREQTLVDENIPEALDAINFGPIVGALHCADAYESARVMLALQLTGNVMHDTRTYTHLYDVVVPNFLESIREYTKSIDHPSAQKEIARVESEMERISSLSAVSRAPEALRAQKPSETMLLSNTLAECGFPDEESRMGLAEKLLKQEGLGLLRSRISSLKRTCRSVDDAMAGLLVKEKPEILLDSNFPEYLLDLSRALSLSKMLGSGVASAMPVSSLLPGEIGETTEGLERQIVERRRSSPANAGTMVETGSQTQREGKLEQALSSDGLDGAVAFRVLKYGLSRHGSVFAAHRVVTEERLLAFAAAKMPKVEAQSIRDEFLKLRANGAIREGKRGTFALETNLDQVAKASVRDSIRYVLTYWGSLRGT